MATIASNDLALSCHQPITLSAGFTQRRRRISPRSARAMETLGHAIEYLSGEFVNAGESHSVNNNHLESVRLLMALNRQVFLECPELPTWNERIRAALRLAQ